MNITEIYLVFLIHKTFLIKILNMVPVMNICSPALIFPLLNFSHWISKNEV